MSVFKPPYELSVWDEKLDSTYKKIERREDTIAAQDMDCLGQASNIKFDTNLNGTHNLSFQIPDGYYDSKTKEFIHNEFVDNLYNEKKVKLFYDDEWYEFYVKSISDEKHHNNYIKTYTCTDSFIEELSRNGYGIIFDEELYNNVEEVGTFTREILEDSVWEYRPEFNWGDFTEYSEEKLFKIPVSLFNGLRGYKLDYNIKSNIEIRNIYTGETRPAEMGDDICSGEYFWDDKQGKLPLTSISKLTRIPNDGYIYVPYTELEFCYRSIENKNLQATEEICYYKDRNGNVLSYALVPTSTNPKDLIQFMAFPPNAEIEIDESGLIVNKDYTYVMTIDDWNKTINSRYYYKFIPTASGKTKIFEQISDNFSIEDQATGNKAAYYEGYLTDIGGVEVINGKKISISDRTEINTTEEIDQYVTVYNNDASQFKDILVKDENWENFYPLDKYTICSKTETRQIVPQLARNLAQNATEIKSTQGWEIQSPYDKSDTVASSSISYEYEEENMEEDGIVCKQISSTYLRFTPYQEDDKNKGIPYESKYNTLINFGLVGQDYTITANKIYCLGIKCSNCKNVEVIIGEGSIVSQGEYHIDEAARIDGSMLDVLDEMGCILIQFNKDIKNPYIAIHSKQTYDLYKLCFFEAYTKGADQFTGESLHYRYSGRELFQDVLKSQNIKGYSVSTLYSEKKMREYILFEDDVMPGDSYSYEHYFIQQGGIDNEKIDTFATKKFLDPEGAIIPKRTEENKNDILASWPLSSVEYAEDDLTFSTAYIDLNKCKYYKQNNLDKCDCSYDSSTPDKICLYQKYGYCPYRFTTQKHCRKIRTLKGEKSNRFNLTQELSKVFEMYPIYYTAHESNGCVTTRQDGTMEKFIFYIKEKGVENKMGFRYEKNLSNISRTIKSEQIVTKLYVSDVDSEISRTGLCSIKTAEDNPSKDSFIIDFSYYTTKGLLDKAQTDADLYGVTKGDVGYLKKLGYLNTQYDELSNKIIALSSQSYTELEANIEVNFNGIEAAQKQLQKYRKEMDKYKTKNSEDEPSEVYKSCADKYNEQLSIYHKLIKETFCDEKGTYIDISTGEIVNKESQNYNLTKFFDAKTLAQMKEMDYIKKHEYPYGMLGQFNKEYEQIKLWKKQQNYYLKSINELSKDFYCKYEPYLKEGTWSDSNYISDNAYYFGAKEVAAEGAIPKVEYNIQVVDLHALPEYEDYIFNIADTTYVEDIGMFGINSVTGLPNRLKVMISGISRVLDSPKDDSIKVQNFTTQFEDLFQQVTASVQSLSFNENIYKRASNFTSNQNISESSLQGTLDNNNLQLLNTSERNIELNKEGQFGSDINNHANKYRINGQGMEFSNDGGQSWNLGVGPGGINADYINVGTLDAGKIRIVDNDYIYFLWTKNGIQAFREPQSAEKNNITHSNFLDYAQFNKYGLSLVENGQLRLRAGYRSTAAGGKASDETDMGKDIGFYLYNNFGEVIFSTESANEYSARLSLGGEMFVTDKLEYVTIPQYTYSKAEYTSKEEYAYLTTNDRSKLDKILVNRDFTIDLYNYFNNKVIPNKNYEIDENTYFTIRWVSLIDRITFDRATNIYDVSSVATISITWYKMELVNPENPDGPKEAIEDSVWDISLRRINSNYQEVTQSIDKIQISSKADSSDKKTSMEEISETNGVHLFKVNYEDKTIEQFILNNVYIFTQDNKNIYYTSKTKNGGDKHETASDAIVMYINNQHINNLEEENEDDNILTRRLLCCAKLEDGIIRNILTVLNNGELYIGGKVNAYDKKGELIETTELDKLSDYIDIDGEGEHYIKLDKDGIDIDGQGILQYVQEEIGKATSSMALIKHSHGIGGAPVVYGDIGSMNGPYTWNTSNQTYGGGATITHGIRVNVEGFTANGEHKAIKVPIEEFIEAIKLQIADGERTSTEGSMSGGGGYGIAGYYVEEFGG